MKKRRSQVDWAGGNPAIKGALLGWLASIYDQHDPRTQDFPNTPALGQLIASARKNLWSEQCYQEILLLGKAANLPFAQFASKLPRVDRAGCCLALPIVIEEEDLEEVPAQVASNSVDGVVATSDIVN